MSEEDRDEIDFTSRHGLFRFTSTTVALEDAPGKFQKAMGVLLTRVEWQFALLYSHNIFLILPMTDHHINHVCEVLLDVTMKSGLRMTMK